ncbi:unnamed protein product [Porites evermanni]|uniref:Uncharacterized protein n=1 Tax=Porites evermanni TaxID=104178 RepID=A0ABN8LV33_9CNID|nr:unnamed protein product [Porites evermanni]
MFKGNHPLKGNNNIDSIKVTFIDKIVENLNTRFPKEESNIVYAFGVLGLRPISLLSPSDLEEWGNSKLETLINHFGKEKEHNKTAAVIDPDQTADEWAKIKPLVVKAGYPRDRMVPLWNLVHNLQNSLKTSVRNRLGSERVDDLMVVSAEGEDLDQFDFNAALQHWRKKKDRRIFTG